jgi:hypothetical protein
MSEKLPDSVGFDCGDRQLYSVTALAIFPFSTPGDKHSHADTQRHRDAEQENMMIMKDSGHLTRYRVGHKMQEYHSGQALPASMVQKSKDQRQRNGIDSGN